MYFFQKIVKKLENCIISSSWRFLLGLENNFLENYIMEQSNCYTFSEIIFQKGILDETVDATYVIHLEGNGRMESIQTQLEFVQPTRRVFLLLNKGYKQCDKDESIQSPPQDLTDAFLQVFQHAQENQFGNILILEDDFEWNPEFLHDSSHQKNIQDFFKKKQGEPFVYRLGCTPQVMIPYQFYHWKLILGGGTHACIYSPSYRESVLQLDSGIQDWDFFTNKHGFLLQYTYYKPLCYQLFPETENSKHWGEGNFVSFFIAQNVMKKIKKFLGLDRSVEPGYSIMYTFAKILFLFFLFLFCFFLYSVASFLGFWKRIRKSFFYKNRSKT